MTSLGTGAAAALALLTATFTAQAAETPIEDAPAVVAATPAVVRYIDPGLGAFISPEYRSQRYRPWPEWREEHSPRRGREGWIAPGRSSSASRSRNWSRPPWGWRTGRVPRLYGYEDRYRYRYGYRSRPYYGFYEWQRPYDGWRGAWRYDLRPDRQPAWRTQWRY
jgi:hypothetical protein